MKWNKISCSKQIYFSHFLVEKVDIILGLMQGTKKDLVLVAVSLEKWIKCFVI